MNKNTGKRARTAAATDTVTLRRAEYERLLAKAGEAIPCDGPPLPKPDAHGNFPAVEYIRASIARELIRRRRAAGLTQVELGELAGVRQETISRLESGLQTVSEPVMERIERVLNARRSRPGQRGKSSRRSTRQHVR